MKKWKEHHDNLYMHLSERNAALDLLEEAMAFPIVRETGWTKEVRDLLDRLRVSEKPEHKVNGFSVTWPDGRKEEFDAVPKKHEKQTTRQKVDEVLGEHAQDAYWTKCFRILADAVDKK